MRLEKQIETRLSEEEPTSLTFSFLPWSYPPSRRRRRGTAFKTPPFTASRSTNGPFFQLQYGGQNDPSFSNNLTNECNESLHVHFPFPLQAWIKHIFYLQDFLSLYSVAIGRCLRDVCHEVLPLTQLAANCLTSILTPHHHSSKCYLGM